MNWAEKAALNNPLRRALQRRYEAPLLQRLGADLAGTDVLEIGCGEGAGARVLLDQFRASRVDGYDVDPAQVTRAQRRLRGLGDRINLQVGDAAALPVAEASRDAVAEFGVFHHVPLWRQAVGEVSRILRPGGMFVFEEVTSHALVRPTYRLLFDHPTEDRFSAEGFRDELRQHGLEVAERHRDVIAGDYTFGVAFKV